MNTGDAKRVGWQVFFLLMILLPVILLFAVPRRGGSDYGVVFVAIVVFDLLMVWLFVRNTTISPEPPTIRMLREDEIPAPIHDLMNVKVALEEEGMLVFRGLLTETPEIVFARLKSSFEPARVPMLQKDVQLGTSIYLLPPSVEKAVLEKPAHIWVNWLLFGLTFLTTTWAGALQEGVDIFQSPGQWPLGLPYSLALLAILGVHELGHYFTARHYQMNVTPPYFIPVPFALGTFGAFIRMRSPAENRQSLFDVAVAGPLAGLALAIPALVIGLHQSAVVPASALEPGRGALGASFISSSILFSLIAKYALGAKLAGIYVVRLSPLAFAGWLGLLVTALNLLPIGQLDGGHIIQAMLGTRGAQNVSQTAMWLFLLVAIFFVPSLLLWAVIVFFIARQGAPPLNDLTPLTPGRLWLGIISFVILASILIPMPKSFWF